LTAAITELLGLLENRPDPRVAFEGINKAHKEIITPKALPVLNSLFRSGDGGRI
jgi:hypothetical protein